MTGILQYLAMASSLILIPVSAHAEDRVTVFAAASLKEALDAVAAASGQEIALSYGGSGLIARQVAQGAPADLVVLANVAWMDWLAEQAPLSDRRDLLSNTLVVVAPAGAAPLEGDLRDRLGGGRLAIGQTNGVPAGIYGRQWLIHEGLWPDLRARLAETENVRAALALVTRGEAPLGVVYGSDAMAEPRVRVALEIPSDTHDPIRYPMAIVGPAPNVATTVFADFLFSEAAQALFEEHGFTPLETP